MRVDSLTIDAVVEDDYSSTLNDLADKLIDLDLLAKRTIENIVADVKIDGALRDIAILDKAVRSVEDDITIGSGINLPDDFGQLRDGFNFDDDGRVRGPNGTIAGSRGIVGANFGEALLEFIKSKSGGPTASSGGSGGTGEGIADGGDDDGGRDLIKLVTEARDQFGSSFNSDILADDADRAQFLTDFLEGQPSDYIDTDALTNALLDDDSDITEDIVENLFSNDSSKSIRAFEVLSDEGLTSLPTRGGIFSNNLGSFGDSINNALESIRGFDATTLNNIRASLFPLFFTFIGALPAAIAGIVSLAGAAIAAAGALVGVVGLGALGVVMSDDISLGDIRTQLIDAIKESFGSAAQALKPTFLEGIDSLEVFIDRLGQTASTLTSLSDEALTFLDSVESYTISGIENVIQFGEIAFGLFQELSSEVDGFSLTESFADILATTVDELLLFINAVIRLTPFIINLSEGFLLAVGGLLSFLGVFGRALSQFPILTQLIGALIAGLLFLVSATLLQASVSSLLSKTLVGGVVKSIGAALASMKMYIITSFKATVASYGLAAAIFQIATAVIAATAGLALLGAAAAKAASDFDMLGGKIGGSRRELRRFSRGGTSMSVGMGSSGGGYSNYFDQSNTTIVAPDKETGGSVSRRHEYSQRIAQQYTT